MKCYKCEIDISEEEKPGNFYIKIINQSKDNVFEGRKPFIIRFCSWNCLEEFIQEEN